MLMRKPLRPLQILPLYPKPCILYRAAKAALGLSAGTTSLQLAAWLGASSNREPRWLQVMCG